MNLCCIRALIGFSSLGLNLPPLHEESKTSTQAKSTIMKQEMTVQLCYSKKLLLPIHVKDIIPFEPFLNRFTMAR